MSSSRRKKKRHVRFENPRENKPEILCFSLDNNYDAMHGIAALYKKINAPSKKINESYQFNFSANPHPFLHMDNKQPHSIVFLAHGSTDQIGETDAEMFAELFEQQVIASNQAREKQHLPPLRLEDFHEVLILACEIGRSDKKGRTGAQLYEKELRRKGFSNIHVRAATSPPDRAEEIAALYVRVVFPRARDNERNIESHKGKEKEHDEIRSHGEDEGMAYVVMLTKEQKEEIGFLEARVKGLEQIREQLQEAINKKPRRSNQGEPDVEGKGKEKEGEREKEKENNDEDLSKPWVSKLEIRCNSIERQIQNMHDQIDAKLAQAEHLIYKDSYYSHHIVEYLEAASRDSIDEDKTKPDPRIIAKKEKAKNEAEESSVIPRKRKNDTSLRNVIVKVDNLIQVRDDDDEIRILKKLKEALKDADKDTWPLIIKDTILNNDLFWKKVTTGRKKNKKTKTFRSNTLRELDDIYLILAAVEEIGQENKNYDILRETVAHKELEKLEKKVKKQTNWEKTKKIIDRKIKNREAMVAKEIEDQKKEIIEKEREEYEKQAKAQKKPGKKKRRAKKYKARQISRDELDDKKIDNIERPIAFYEGLLTRNITVPRVMLPTQDFSQEKDDESGSDKERKNESPASIEPERISKGKARGPVKDNVLKKLSGDRKKLDREINKRARNKNAFFLFRPFLSTDVEETIREQEELRALLKNIKTNVTKSGEKEKHESDISDEKMAHLFLKNASKNQSLTTTHKFFGLFSAKTESGKTISKILKTYEAGKKKSKK